jgi:glycosyltransferase involved in cell wall biosynthesis
MSNISVIIPTYKEPEHLELCLTSLFEGAENTNFEVIVVVDGTLDINKHVISKFVHTPNLNYVAFEENRGLSMATNYGVYSANQDYILVVNDDNVFPRSWDAKLEGYCEIYKDRFVISPNQIEPNPSMFKQFVIKDFGHDPSSFDFQGFKNFEEDLVIGIDHDRRFDFSGSTLPFMMKKTDFLALGGWDELYPSPHVVDWDFFLKCEYFNFAMMRIYDVHFYHFAGAATRKTVEDALVSQEKEHLAHQFFAKKWKHPAHHNPENNSKLLPVFKNGRN